jgi:hypothetical protein
VRLPNADHFVFYSNEAHALSEINQMNSLISKLPPPVGLKRPDPSAQTADLERSGQTQPWGVPIWDVIGEETRPNAAS